MAVLFAVPAITMRLLAEERRSGTIESLLTVPVTEGQVVAAKWLAGWIIYATLLVPFLLYLPFLRQVGRYLFDVGPVVSLTIGLLSIGAMFVAIGVFFSALTRNQAVAAIATFAALFLILILSVIGYAGAYQRQSPWLEGIRFLTVLHQAQEFGAGQLDLRYLALHASITGFFLFLTVKVLQGRRGA